VAFEFKLPDLGEGIREAQVLAWKVSPGQLVAAFQPLCEVESAKAAVELTAPVAGRVVETRFTEGETARLGEVLVVIDTGEVASAPPLDRRLEKTQNERRGPAANAATDSQGWFGIVGTPPRDVSAPRRAEEGHVLAAPFVRKLARERGIRLEEVAGSGPHGRVRIADLDAVTSTERTIPLKGLRKTIADHMVEAWQSAPQVTSMDLLDVTELVHAREVLMAGAETEGTRLTYLPFFVKSAVQALKAVPEANAVIDQKQAAILLKSDYHIGIATAIQGGLVVPVVRHADRLSLLEIARDIERLVADARERRSTPADLSGSTFTITSFGGLAGSPMFATPILNHPEVAILGLGRIELQPRVVDGQVVPRHCIGVSFTFDHRVLDGEAAGRFMAELKRYLETPLELLLRLH
jgi:pyruvate dehydrogenase E2 component (dihydrolipoamide acetyltransferase)